MSEVVLSKTLQRGDSGFDVQRVQEWLTLGGYGLVIDGQFGTATQLAVRKYQSTVNAAADGIVTPALFDLLVAPMKAATASINPAGYSLGGLAVAYARQHLTARAREVGGNNRGPWVRLYMGGNDGAAWPWCAGFVCFCLGQAAQSLDVPLPIQASYSCSRLGDNGRAAGLLINGDDTKTRAQLLKQGGSLFLVRGTTEEWEHTGLVQTVESDAFTTIEGNSDTTGSRDAYEVCSNTRGWTDGKNIARDFILIA
jgi:peptidoglycan hydrolase-like protein with peptidoglycan-binding domain